MGVLPVIAGGGGNISYDRTAEMRSQSLDHD